MKKTALILFLLLICCASALAEPAEDITKQAKFTVPGLVSGTLRRLTDRDRQTALQTEKQKQPTLTVTMKEGVCAALYIEYGNNIMPFTVQAQRDGGWVDLARWEESYAQAYVAFEPQTDFRLVFDTDNTRKALYIRELYLFSEGEMNDTPQIWQPACEKSDLLVLAAHPDDELLWFGGLIPYYAGERGMAVQVCYLTCANSCRRVELLNGLWHCGVRNYPDIGNYKDIKLYNAAKLYPQWGGVDAVDRYVVRLLRRYQPEVAVTQALDGEYGHAAHVVCGRSMQRAAELAADPEYDPESVALYGVWQGKKVYLHKGDVTLTMDWRQPCQAFDGKTSFEVAEEAYRLHESQPQPRRGKPSLYYVTPETDKNSSFVYSLAYSTVGEDVIGGDMFENISAEFLTR